ncbi:MAG: phosphatidate cytidylyltransferase [Nitrospinae bacterium]|nr:phosphatidate cytidylyltransferase [Nitrospinota bacterium]MZH40487.1 phosphatidate cytidylyltransferase [Nitrospinota bacterium]
MKRVISGVIAIPLVLGIVLYGSPLLFFGFVALIVLVASYEFFSMISNMGVDGFPVEGGVLCLLILTGFYLGEQYLMLCALLIPIVLFATWFLRENDVKLALDPISYTVLGVFYTAGLGGYFLLIHKLEGGNQMIVFLLLLIWLGDAAAYYVGKNLGKNKLMPTVSPNKTVEGAIANVLGTLVAAVIASYWFFEEFSLTHCLIVAFLCGIIGQFGDFSESLIKRNCRVKDSGSLIPGHGGFLDRIDSLLFAGPAFYCYYKLFLGS